MELIPAFLRRGRLLSTFPHLPLSNVCAQSCIRHHRPALPSAWEMNSCVRKPHSVCAAVQRQLMLLQTSRLPCSEQNLKTVGLGATDLLQAAGTLKSLSSLLLKQWLWFNRAKNYFMTMAGGGKNCKLCYWVDFITNLPSDLLKTATEFKTELPRAKSKRSRGF